MALFTNGTRSMVFMGGCTDSSDCYYPAMSNITEFFNLDTLQWTYGPDFPGYQLEDVLQLIPINNGIVAAIYDDASFVNYNAQENVWQKLPLHSQIATAANDVSTDFSLFNVVMMMVPDSYCQEV